MIKFLLESIKHPKLVGACAAHSKDSVNLGMSTINLKKAKVIIEIGCGTGVFTEKILAQKNKNAIFFGLEINKNFIKLLNEKFPDADIYEDSAINLDKYLSKYNLKRCDCIISTLPWAAFSIKMQTEILDAIYKNLTHQGQFITIAYRIGLHTPAGKKFKKLLASKFSLIKTTETVKNLPPAFFYYCIK